MQLDSIVIGGGFYGARLALALRAEGESVLLLEREPTLLGRASLVNQARVHNGYHYPRSILTSVRSRQNYDRFREEYAESIEILRVETRSSGFWAAYSVLEPFAEETIGRWIDLACRKIWLTGTAEQQPTRAIQLGTETLRLARLLKTIHPETSQVEWRHILADFERSYFASPGQTDHWPRSPFLIARIVAI